MQIMQTVFDADGTAFEVEPVDAREYVASGAYTYEAPAKKSKAGKKPAATDQADASETSSD